MVNFDIRQLVPSFIWNDRNGHALAVALACGMKIMCETVQDAVDCVFDVSKMPEWRLDEMAWELGCLYDYSAPVETKRRWIENAIPLFSAYGTVAAMHEYLDAFFDSMDVEEAHLYGGEPYHFRIVGTGEWTEEKRQWLTKAVERVKNVRSVLDGVYAGRTATLQLTGERRVWPSPVPFPGDGVFTGTIPNPSTLAVITERATDLKPQGNNYPVPFIMTGTVPNYSTLTAFRNGETNLPTDGSAYAVPFQTPSEEIYVGE